MTFRRLLDRFASAAAAIASLPGLAKAGGRALAPVVPAKADADREIAALRKLGGKFLVLGQPDYPELLALLDDAPPVVAVLVTQPFCRSAPWRWLAAAMPP